VAEPIHGTLRQELPVAGRQRRRREGDLPRLPSSRAEVRRLSLPAKLTASNTRGNAKKYGPKNVLDGDRHTYWCTDDAITTPELVLELRKPGTFNVVDLREYLPLGQRVEAFALDQWQDGQWREFAKGTSIGNRRLIRGDYVTTDKVRLRITKAAVCPAIAEIGFYAEPRAAAAKTVTSRTGVNVVASNNQGAVEAHRFSLAAKLAPERGPNMCLIQPDQAA